MPKRFTDTDKWKKGFIKGLPTEYKLFWLYLLDDCNHAGIWNVELDVAQARLGIQLSLEKIRGFFKERIVEFDGGTKWFIPDFITFQYGSLKAGNNTHNSVLAELKKYNLEGLPRGSRAPQDTDTVKDKDKDKEGGGDEKNDPVGLEFVSSIAKGVWSDQRWKEATCMGHRITFEELQAWMAQYNVSLSSDSINGLDGPRYKKMFGGWLNSQKAKGYTVAANKPKPDSTLKRLA